VDGLEHVTFMTADGVDPAPEGIVRTLADRHITVGLTLGVAPVPGMTMPPEMTSRLPTLVANARRLYAAGVPITAGTDAGIGPIKPPDVLCHAVAHLEQLGMSGATALRACTSEAAAVCGLGHRKGRLAPGYDADILAVQGDPITDPTALHRIRAVYVRGRRVTSRP